MFEDMDIYASPGTKVRFMDANGYKSQLEQARRFLVRGAIYTVERTDVHSFSTDVYLVEVPGQRFNSVHFEEVRE